MRSTYCSSKDSYPICGETLWMRSKEAKATQTNAVFYLSWRSPETMKNWVEPMQLKMVGLVARISHQFGQWKEGVFVIAGYFPTTGNLAGFVMLQSTSERQVDGCLRWLDARHWYFSKRWECFYFSRINSREVLLWFSKSNILNIWNEMFKKYLVHSPSA